MDVKDTVTVVTGGAQGIGLAVHVPVRGQPPSREHTCDDREHPMNEVTADPFHRIDRSTAITDDAVHPYYLSDRKLRVSVARVAGCLYAFDDLCTCADEPCPLSGGLLRETTIMCQCHGSRFDIATGAVVDGPATEALHVYEVHELDGDIRIRA